MSLRKVAFKGNKRLFVPKLKVMPDKDYVGCLINEYCKDFDRFLFGKRLEAWGIGCRPKPF
jgi:hypothetical protein